MTPEYKNKLLKLAKEFERFSIIYFGNKSMDKHDMTMLANLSYLVGFIEALEE